MRGAEVALNDSGYRVGQLNRILITVERQVTVDGNTH